MTSHAPHNDETRRLCECKKCGWKWFARKEAPKTCPKCKTAFWRVGRQRETKPRQQ